MSILSSKTKDIEPKKVAAEDTKEAKKKASAKPSKVTGKRKGVYAHILSAPRITEKAAFSGDKGAYVFNVSVDATKVDIKKAFAEVYGIDPVKVTITRIPKKPTFVRGQRGTKGGGKKATVFLAPGQKIDIV